MTKAEALSYQAEDLVAWKSVLTPEAYAQLHSRVVANNDWGINPYDVTRGQDLLEIVMKLAYANVS